MLELDFKVRIVRNASRSGCEWVSSDIDHIDAFGECEPKDVSLVVDDVEGQVNLLQLEEVDVRVEELVVDLAEPVSAQVQSLQSFDLAKCSEEHLRTALN